MSLAQTVILPTIGRIVWFFPAIDNGRHADGQPFAALVAGINADDNINLTVSARDGSTYGAQNVLLVQDGDQVDQDAAHAVWMPYQKGQAAKAEALQASTAPATTVDLQPIHNKIAGLETATQGKFEELGNWLTKMFSDFEGKLTALTTAPAAPPPAPDAPAPAAAPEDSTAAGASQAAPQGTAWTGATPSPLRSPPSATG